MRCAVSLMRATLRPARSCAKRTSVLSGSPSFLPATEIAETSLRCGAWSSNFQAHQARIAIRIRRERIFHPPAVRRNRSWYSTTDGGPDSCATPVAASSLPWKNNT
jgi:hypothetical protein